jgi:16S rRNA (guanine527-N7)-methyltransferase
MKTAARALTLCGGKLTERYDYTLPTGEKRAIYLVEKVALTPAQYPRTEGKPARRPIK